MSDAAGYSGTPLVRKIGVKPGARALVVNVPADAPPLFADGVRVLRRAGGGRLDAIVVFVTSRGDLARRLPALRQRLEPAGMLWVAWPKRSFGVDSDPTTDLRSAVPAEDAVRDMTLPIGLVDVKVIAIDATWSGLKLMVRKELR